VAASGVTERRARDIDNGGVGVKKLLKVQSVDSN